jgi:multisubunit Na+/H+ antiporter MnhE subunit
VDKETAIWGLGVLGWLLSYALFARWLLANEWQFFGGWAEAFTSSDFATGLLMDLVVVTVMVIVVALKDRRRLGPRWSVAIILSLALSVSMALAIYLVALWRTESKAAITPPEHR